MSAEIIQFTEVCRECGGVGSYVHVDLDGWAQGLHRCSLCNGTGHTVRALVWELSWRRKLARGVGR
jgi:DnaJ-class molecular chaperone